jgi:hypothetical protein
MDIFILLLLIAILLIPYGYVLVRGMSRAYFKTKWEHHQRIMKDLDPNPEQEPRDGV